MMALLVACVSVKVAISPGANPNFEISRSRISFTSFTQPCNVLKICEYLYLSMPTSNARRRCLTAGASDGCAATRGGAFVHEAVSEIRRRRPYISRRVTKEEHQRCFSLGVAQSREAAGGTTVIEFSIARFIGSLHLSRRWHLRDEHEHILTRIEAILNPGWLMSSDFRGLLQRRIAPKVLLPEEGGKEGGKDTLCQK